MEISEFKQFEKQSVVLTTVKDAVYTGIITPVYKVKDVLKVKLTKMVVCNKNGSYKAVSGCTSNNERVFNCSSIKSIKLL